MRSRPRWLRAVAIGAAIFLASGTALSAASAPSLTSYTGCLQRLTGIPYNIAAGTEPASRCLGKDQVISWSIRGPVGPAGPKGDQGEVGPAGAKGDPGDPGVTTLDQLDGTPCNSGFGTLRVTYGVDSGDDSVMIRCVPRIIHLYVLVQPAHMGGGENYVTGAPDNPEIFAIVDGDWILPAGSDVTLTASVHHADGPLVFDHWEGDCATIDENQCTVHMDAPKAVTAFFRDR